MPAALPIREDLSASELRALARRENKGRVAIQMFAIAHALDGVSRAEAARLAGMDRQALRDAMVRYNAEGVTGLYDRPPGGTVRNFVLGGVILKRKEPLHGTTQRARYPRCHPRPVAGRY